MREFLDQFKENKYFYFIVLAAITTIILVNEIFDFADKIVNNYFTIFFSIIIFLFLIFLSTRRRIIEDERQSDFKEES